MPLSNALRLRKLMLPALGAGLVAGVGMAILQQLFLVPMILAAEAIELGGARNVHHGIDRVLYTVVFDCLGAFGFALLLSAAYTLRGNVSLRAGIGFGLAGFASFALAPALGLPPELPGAESSALLARQLWWIATVASTAGGIACVIRAGPLMMRIAGVLLILAPHLVGAPGGGQLKQVMSQPLARDFAVASLAVSAVMWMVLGVLTAWWMRRVTSSDSRSEGTAGAGA